MGSPEKNIQNILEILKVQVLICNVSGYIKKLWKKRNICIRNSEFGNPRVRRNHSVI